MFAVSYRRKNVVLNEAILANMKTVIKYGFSVFSGKNKIFFFQTLLKLHERNFQTNQEARVLKIEKIYTLYGFSKNILHIYPIILVNTKTTIPLGVGA